MQRVRILKTFNGSADGINERVFLKDTEHDCFDDAMVRSLFSGGLIELVEENKAIAKSPETKPARGKKKSK